MHSSDFMPKKNFKKGDIGFFDNLNIPVGSFVDRDFDLIVDSSYTG